MCVTCNIGADADLDYIKNIATTVGTGTTAQTVTQTTLYICDFYAKELYAPGMDPNFVSLDKPTTAFDSCGSYQFAADGTNTTRDFAS